MILYVEKNCLKVSKTETRIYGETTKIVAFSDGHRNAGAKPLSTCQSKNPHSKALHISVRVHARVDQTRRATTSPAIIAIAVKNKA
jgi:hypothetical protein